MSGGLISFNDYIFSNLGRYSSNFAQQKSQTTRLAGMDGGIDRYGDDPAPAPVGRVTQSFKLIAATPALMVTERDAVRLMQSYGTAKLYYQPSDPSEPVRWTWARMLTPTITEDKSGNTDIWQPVSVIFECAESVWWVDTYVGWTWGDGWKWGDPGHVWGGGGFEINSFAAANAVLPNGGNAISIPHITVEPQPGQSCANPIIQRLDGGLVVETFSYTGILLAGEVLDIDGRSQTVSVDGNSVFDDISYETPAFFNLPPGDNNIRILLEDSGGSAPTTAYDAGANDLDGTYNNVTVGDGTGIYNGNTAYLDAFSAALATFFDEAQGSMITKSIADVGVLADGIRRDLFQFGVDGNNYIGMSKTVGGVFNAEYVAGGTSKSQALSYSDDTNHVAAQTWDAGDDEFKAYLDGVQAGSTGKLLGTWAGALSTGYIGAFSSGANFWKGGISDVILSNQVADGTQMATIDSKLAAGALKATDLNTIFGTGNWAWWGMNESTQAARVIFSYRDSYR